MTRGVDSAGGRLLCSVGDGECGSILTANLYGEWMFFEIEDEELEVIKAF